LLFAPVHGSIVAKPPQNSEVGNHSLLQEAFVRTRRALRLRPFARSVLSLPVAGDLLRRLMQRILPRGTRIWSQVLAGPARGLWLKVEPYQEDRYLSGYPEPGVQDEIAKHLAPAGCFYDLGAHIGYYSLLAARLVGGAGRVVAFEPDPTNVAVLRENIMRNGVSRVLVVPAAVWSQCGTVVFRRSAPERPDLSSRRGAVVTAIGKSPDSNLINVEALTLDAFASAHYPPTMIKIDVEGAEIEVFKAAQEVISRSRPVILVEVHHQSAATFLQDRLFQNGYRIEWLPGHPEFAFPRHLLARPPQWRRGCP